MTPDTEVSSCGRRVNTRETVSKVESTLWTQYWGGWGRVLGVPCGHVRLEALPSKAIKQDQIVDCIGTQLSSSEGIDSRHL